MLARAYPHISETPAMAVALFRGNIRSSTWPWRGPLRIDE